MPIRKMFAFVRQVFFACLIVSQILLIQMPTRIAYASDEPPSTIIISAVQITGGTGHTQEDFIELYNPTDEPLDLNGFRLVKRTAAGTTDSVIKAWTESTMVPAYHFYLWANSGFTAIVVPPDSTSTGTLADNNGIALRQGVNDSGLVIDSLAWGSTANGFASVSSSNPTANQSLTRTDLFSHQANFSTSVSQPRNSSSSFIPPEPEPTPIPDPEPLPEPIPDPTPDPDPEPTPTPTQISLKITELLPNPSGSDSGFEQVEIYNDGESVVNLKDFKLDDVSNIDSLSSNAYTFGDANVEPDSYLAVTIPSGKFALNNTGGDVVTLFDDTLKPLDTAFYEEAATEGYSWAYFREGWAWTNPTFGEENILIVIEEEESEDSEEEDLKHSHNNSDLIISEVYPQPNAGEQEFIEIYNSGKDTAELSEVDLYIGEKHRQLPEHELTAGEYYVLSQADLPIQLRNSGQVIKLQEGAELINTVSYPTSLKGSSYATFEDGFLWTTKMTKGEENILQLPEEVKKVTAKVAATTAKTATKTSASKAKTTATKTVAKKTAAKTTTMPKTATTPSNTNKANTNSTETIEPNKSITPSKDSVGKIIAMGVATVAAGVIALYKFVFTTGIE